jgi:putative endonuclease
VKKAGWHVYILRCSDASFYTGISNNVEQRIRNHNRGRGAKYTQTRRPVELVYQEASAGQRDAMRRELQIKTWPRARKEALIMAGNKKSPARPRKISRNLRPAARLKARAAA